MKVYSNLPKVALYVDGRLFAEQEGSKVFVFEHVPMSDGFTQISARAGACADAMSIEKVAEPNQAYIYVDPDDTGDDAGAAALGRYSAHIKESGGCDMLYVVNAYRYLTRTSGEAAQILGEIECAARLTATAVVNNSNLAEITTAEDISRSAAYARETALQYQIPLYLRRRARIWRTPCARMRPACRFIRCGFMSKSRGRLKAARVP